MQSQPERVAGDVAYHLPAGVSQLITELGQDRLKALQTSGVALDARCTQTAAILFAATAFTANLVFADHTPPFARFCGILACIAFVIGSGNACFGMMARPTHVSGLEPAWWARALAEDAFGEDMARSWLADVTQEMIDIACKVDEGRAQNLNWALVHGFGGAVLVSIAAAARLLSGS